MLKVDWKKVINPCEYRAYWWLIKWVETDCICCSATRMLIVAFPIGVLVGLLLPHSTTNIVIVLVVLLFVPFILMAARLLWQDETPEKTDAET